MTFNGSIIHIAQNQIYMTKMIVYHEEILEKQVGMSFHYSINGIRFQLIDMRKFS